MSRAIPLLPPFLPVHGHSPCFLAEGRQRPEVRSQKSEVRSQRPEINFPYFLNVPTSYFLLPTWLSLSVGSPLWKLHPRDGTVRTRATLSRLPAGTCNGRKPRQIFAN